MRQEVRLVLGLDWLCQRPGTTSPCCHLPIERSRNLVYATRVIKPENWGLSRYSEPGREHSIFLARLISITKH
jgi:hypothetical protein